MLKRKTGRWLALHHSLNCMDTSPALTSLSLYMLLRIECCLRPQIILSVSGRHANQMPLPLPAELLPSSVSRSSKRRKLNSSVSTPQRGPLALLSSHTGPVSAAIFDFEGFNCRIFRILGPLLRTWDLVTSALVDTRSTSHPLLSLKHLPELHLLAAGTSARHIPLIDPRASATSVSVMTLRGHTNAVVTLARDLYQHVWAHQWQPRRHMSYLGRQVHQE